MHLQSCDSYDAIIVEVNIAKLKRVCRIRGVREGKEEGYGSTKEVTVELWRG